MGRLEAGSIPFNPHNSDATMYRPDGSSVITHVELEDPKPPVRLGRGHLSEADHVIVAMNEGVPVQSATASDEEGETRVGKPNAKVAAAHWDRGGDGWDNLVLGLMGANKHQARREASTIKTRRGHERDSIAELLARKGSATGSEMEHAAAEAREDEEKGKRIKITVSIIEKDGTIVSFQGRGRAKDSGITVPDKLVALKPESRGGQANPQRRQLVPAG